MNTSHRTWSPSIKKIREGKTGKYLGLQTLSVLQFKRFTPELILSSRLQALVEDG
jgi:hypothetical protein